jgi:hypothetical protein
MRLLFFILLIVLISCPLSAQGVTKSGQNTATGGNFVNKNGEIVSEPALSRFGQELFPGSVTTAAVSSITNTTAISGGNIAPDGGGTIISRGVCWSTTAHPTTAGNKTTDGSGSGSFTSNITGLLAGTTYYVRAYATDSEGTTYGNQVIFTTLKLLYETLSSAVYSESPEEIKDITFGNVHFTKIADGPVNCGSAGTYLAKTIEDAYSIVGSDSVVNFDLTGPELHRFVEDGINCEVFDISGKYIYYGHSSAFYRIDKNTFGNKVKFLISGIWEGALGYDVSAREILGVNEMPDSGLLIQLDNNEPHSNFYKVPFVDRETGNYTYTQTDAVLVMDIPFNDATLNKAWGLSFKDNMVFAVVYTDIGQAYLSTDSGNSFKCVFSMADASINSTVTEDQMVFVDTRPDGQGGFGATGGHPMKNTLTNPQDYDLWGETSNGSLHSHGGCIDKYSDRLIIVTGDGYPAVGIFYSDDWGYNWTLIKTGTYLPSADSRTQFVTVIPLEDCILFGNDGSGDGYWRVFRNGSNLFSTIENCYQFTGTNTELVTINGGNCFTQDGTMLGLINPHESPDYTTTKGGIVATKNGHNFRKLYEDSFSNFTLASAEFGRRGLISVNDNNKVLVKAKNGGLIILDMTPSDSSK